MMTKDGEMGDGTGQAVNEPQDEEHEEVIDIDDEGGENFDDMEEVDMEEGKDQEFELFRYSAYILLFRLPHSYWTIMAQNSNMCCDISQVRWKGWVTLKYRMIRHAHLWLIKVSELF